MIKKIICLGAILVMIFSLAACGETKRHKNSDTSLDTELEIQIRQDFIQQMHDNNRPKLKDIWVQKHYGTFDESVVVLMRTTANLPPAMVSEDVAGFEFWTNTGERISVWKDGNFCSLTKAYDDGLLSRDNIESIHEKI